LAEGVAGANPKAVALRILPLLELSGPEEIAVLCAKAKTPFGPLAAVRVAPDFVSVAKGILTGSLVGVATTAASVEAVVAAVAAGADDIEISDTALVRQCRIACRRGGGANASLTVNLETGRIGDAGRIREAAGAAINAGADRIATASGDAEPGVSLAAAQAVLEAIAAARSRRIWAGIKIAGGIRTLAEATRYLALGERLLGSEFLSPATFRFGSAELLDDLRAALR
jgi:deoxyribose-phosphate aldolase